MSSLTPAEKRKLEHLFGMRSGYVLGFSNNTFEEFFSYYNLDIFSERYDRYSGSKANRLRRFWEVEDDYLVGKCLLELVIMAEGTDATLSSDCIDIANRLLTGGPNLANLTETAGRLQADDIKRQISRMEGSINSDPELAIGTAKELIETCCKTILQERNALDERNVDLSELVRATLRELRLTREDIPDSVRGADTIRRVVSNLGSIANGINELRNLYGTGHGRTARTPSLSPRHARLAVGSTSALVQFLFETHTEQMNKASLDDQAGPTLSKR